MKKLIWSAFAMSLITVSAAISAQTEAVDEFLGLESELLPELKGEQRFTGSALHEAESWNVDPSKVAIDLPRPNKGQKHSIIPWNTLDPEEWLSIDKWLLESDAKNATPDWKIRLRAADHKELMGKVLQCKGTCSVYRGSRVAQVQHLSQVFEGDEFKTEKDSVAWIYLVDGSLIRLSPETSVSLHEINLSHSQIFFLARLNQGHLFWHPRSKSEVQVDFSPETDSISLPLLVREANQENFERTIFKEQKDQERVSEVMSLDDNAIKSQFKALNEIKNENNPAMTVKTKVMVVTPNSSVVSSDVSFDYLYLPGGKSYFKKRNNELGEEFSLHLRGYTTTEANVISESKWHEVDTNGRNFVPLEDVPGTLQVLELLTKRIKTIELARELWVKTFTLPLMKALVTPEILAREHGYALWGEDLNKRFNFLVEYTRRIETTNLRSLENLLTKLEGKGEEVRRELSDEQYQVSLNHYLLGLKSRYDKKKMRVREMNDLQFYVWILKNGKF